MKNFKKVVAGVSAIALVAMNANMFNANAANANPTLTYTDAGVASVVTDDTLQIVIPANINTSDADTVVVLVRDSAGNAVDLNTGTPVVITEDGANITTSAVVADTSGKINVAIATAATAADITVTFNVDSNTPNGIYSVSIIGTAGNGSTAFYVGNANVVNVSATVAPFLNFAVTNTAVSFGELNADSSVNNSLTDTNIQASTNAAGDLVVKANVANAGLTGSVTGHIITGNTEDTLTTTGGFSLTSTDNGSATDTANITFQTNTLATGSDQEIMTASINNIGKSVNFDVTYNAKIATTGADIAPADSYTTTVTYTVTGNF